MEGHEFEARLNMNIKIDKQEQGNEREGNEGGRKRRKDIAPLPNGYSFLFIYIYFFYTIYIYYI